MGPASSQTATIPVANAGFEQVDPRTGVPLDWTPWSQDNLCAYSLAMAHSGVASALVTDADGTMSQGLRCKPVPIEPGKSYEASCWMNIAELKAGGFALYLEYWRGTERVHNVAVSSSVMGSWQPLKVAAPAPPGATSASVIIYGSSATIGAAYFDDVALTLQP
ncbi:MAG: hypothetical protein WCP21_06980 [Armatimonadota bacterium]